MAKEVVFTQEDLDKIQSTEKLTKATLIVVSVAAGIMVLFILASSIHMVVGPRGQGVMMQQRPGLRGSVYRQGIQPQSGTQNTQNGQTQQGQTESSTGTVELDAL